MAALGAVGFRLFNPRYVANDVVSSRCNIGALSITGTARVNEVAGITRVDLFALNSPKLLMSKRSASDGSFTFSNLAAGLYVVQVNGHLTYAPKRYIVEVS